MNNKLDLNKLSLPEESKILNISNLSIFLISFVTEVLGIIIVISKFKSLSLEFKIIILLCIACFIMFIDIIFLYIKDRENYFRIVFYTNMYKSMCKEIDYVKELIEDNITKQS